VGVQAFQFEEGTLVTWTSRYNDLMIWDLKSPKQNLEPLKILNGHMRQVKCAIPLLDDRIVSGSSDYQIKIWDSVSGDCVATFLGHRDAITCSLRFSSSSSSGGGSSSSKILSASRDGTLRIWDPSIVSSHSVPPCLATLHHASPVLQVIQLADGRVVSGSFDALKIWNIETGECMTTIPTGHGRYLREDMRIFQLNEGATTPLSLVLIFHPLNFDMTVWNIATMIPEQRWHRRRLFLLVAKYCRTHSELDGLSPSLRRIANLNSGGSGSSDARFVLVEKIASML